MHGNQASPKTACDPADAEAAATIAALETAATCLETPCGDGRMVWRRWGEGPTLVLLHGGHGAWTHWVRNIAVLAEHFALLVPDMPGFGDSDSPPHPYTAESLAEILATGLDQLLGSDANYAITGFSFGGVMAGQVARLRPRAVRRLVLVGAGGTALPRPPMRAMKNWRLTDDPPARRQAHRNNLEVLMLHDPANVDALALRMQTLNAPRTRINSRAISRTDALARTLDQFPAPLAGIWGTLDVTAGEFLDQREALLRRHDRGAEFVRIPAGHWVQYEAPEPFHAALIDILGIQRSRD